MRKKKHDQRNWNFFGKVGLHPFDRNLIRWIRWIRFSIRRQDGCRNSMEGLSFWCLSDAERPFDENLAFRFSWSTHWHLIGRVFFSNTVMQGLVRPRLHIMWFLQEKSAVLQHYWNTTKREKKVLPTGGIWTQGLVIGRPALYSLFYNCGSI